MKSILLKLVLIAISFVGISSLAIADPAAVFKDGACGIPTPTGAGSGVSEDHQIIAFGGS